MLPFDNTDFHSDFDSMNPIELEIKEITDYSMSASYLIFH